MFTASVGNLPPGKEAVLRLTTVSELPLEGDAIRFTLPTAIAPRYAPADDRKGVGETEAERRQPALRPPGTYGLTLEVDVRTTAPVRSVESPSHPISVTIDDGRATVRLSEREAALDRDVVLKIALAETHQPRAARRAWPRWRRLRARVLPPETRVRVGPGRGHISGRPVRLDAGRLDRRGEECPPARPPQPASRLPLQYRRLRLELPLALPGEPRLRRREPGGGHAARETARRRPGRHRNPARARARARLRAANGAAATAFRPDRRRGQQH